MNLVQPTDFEILAYLSRAGRNNAVNMAVALDKDRSYVNTRLRYLAAADLVERVGPAPNSGLYELTPRGEAALEHREAYADRTDDFEAALDAWTAE
jgi:DNA-binding MarR family transcriptional regulator